MRALLSVYDKSGIVAFATRLHELGVELQPHSVKYLIERHFKMTKRSMRFCHPRDLLRQVVHLCEYERRARSAGPREWDRVVANYFV